MPPRIDCSVGDKELIRKTRDKDKRKFVTILKTYFKIGRQIIISIFFTIWFAEEIAIIWKHNFTVYSNDLISISAQHDDVIWYHPIYEVFL